MTKSEDYRAFLAWQKAYYYENDNHMPERAEIWQAATTAERERCADDFRQAMRDAGLGSHEMRELIIQKYEAIRKGES